MHASHDADSALRTSRPGPIWAVARAMPIRHWAGLDGMARHAARDDVTARRRRRSGVDAPDPQFLALAWRQGYGEAYIPRPPDAAQGDSLSGEPLPAVARVREAVEQRIAETGARVRGDARVSGRRTAIALALLVGVSLPWVRETGGLWDPNNPRVRQLLREAIRWGDATFGPGAVVAARVDLDEWGGGVVDLMVVPIFDKHLGRRHRDGSLPEPQPVVSVATARDELNKTHGHERYQGWAGLQDSWHQWCVTHIDPCIQRGRPRKETLREHLPPDEYSAAIEARRAEANEAAADAAEARRLRDIDLEAADQALKVAEEARRERDAARAQRDADLAAAEQAAHDYAQIAARLDDIHAQVAQLHHVQSAARRTAALHESLPGDVRATLDELASTPLPPLASTPRRDDGPDETPGGMS